MRRVVVYLKFVAFSTAALALAACARLSLADTTMFRTEPRFGDPPVVKLEPEKPVPLSESERQALLERQVAELDVQIARLRETLSIMAPTPKASDFMVSATPTNDVALARLYAPAPAFPPGSSLFGWSDSCTKFTGPRTACRSVEPVPAFR